MQTENPLNVQVHIPLFRLLQVQVEQEDQVEQTECQVVLWHAALTHKHCKHINTVNT